MPFCRRLSAASRRVAGRLDRALRHRDLRVEARLGEEGPLGLEHDLLVRAVEPQVGGQ